MPLTARLLALLRRDRLSRDLDDEMHFHLEMRERDNLAAGMSPAQARREARRRFGNPALVKERTRAVDLLGWLEDAAADLRYGVRLLIRSPGFTAVAVLTLALGIGANAAIWSVIDAVLLQPLPYAAPGEVVTLGQQLSCCPFGPLSPATLLDYQRANHSFAVLSGSMGSPFVLNRAGGEPLFLLGNQVAANYFDVFGVPARLGRTLTPAADRPGAPCAAVLSWATWRRDFGADPRAVGRSLLVNDHPCTLVGVMPRSFSFMSRAEIWVGAAFALPVPDSDTHGDLLTRRDTNYLRPFGRLRPGVTLAAAGSELDAIRRRLALDHPQANLGKAILLRPLRRYVIGDAAASLWMLFGAVGLILLIACANLAGLLLARGAVRAREIALRASLGAGRLRLVRQLLTETWLLAALGGAAGLLLAVWGLRLFSSLGPEQLPRIAELHLRPGALLFTGALSLAAGTLAGLAPALHALRLPPGTVLKQGGRAARGAGQRARRLLVVAEIAMSVALLIGTGLLIRSFANLLAIDPGFRPDGVLAADLQLPPRRYPADAQVAAFTRQLLSRLAALPGVAGVGLIDAVPFGNGDQNGDIRIEGRPPARPGDELVAEKKIAGGDYFRTMRIPLLAGRAFDDHDTAESAPAVIVNQHLARLGWPGQDPLGRRLSWDSGKTWMTVVGVVGNVHLYSLDEKPMLDTYRPFSQRPISAFTLVARRATDPLALGAQLRKEVTALDPRQPVGEIDLLADQVDASLAQRRLQMLLSLVLAVLALALASLGVYGLIAYTVEQRTGEIGLRLAVGAQRRQVVGLVMRSSLLTAAAGVAAGAAASLAIGHWIEKLLFEVHGHDPAVFALGCATLLAVALLAAWLPARRAAAIDPVTALRRE